MIFIDTGAFFARFVAADLNHGVALKKFEEIESRKIPCVTSNFVIDETLTLLGRKTSYAFAARVGRALYGSNAMAIERPDESDEFKALTYFDKFSDQEFSFTDCISFVLMKKRRIKTALAFGSDFEIAGFNLFV